MADIYSKLKRSQIMASIGSKDTKPEVAVRSLLFKQGFRFRKNVKKLPGTPDIVLPKYGIIIQIHGCFWHGHKNCSKSKLPTTNIVSWKSKIEANIERDKRIEIELRKLGWKIITIWQCQIKNENILNITMDKLIKRII